MNSNFNKSSIKEYPEYAAICSFIQLFGEELGLYITHKQLVKYLEIEDTETVPKIWIDIHRKLLYRIKYGCSVDKWETKLRSFIYNLSGIQEAYKYDFTSYVCLKPKERAHVFNILLNAQFDRNIKFKEKVNLRKQESLRIKPLGSDIFGCLYWYFADKEFNIIIYKENLEEETFKIIAETVDDMKRIHDELSEIDVNNVDLSNLYKLPDESDSPLIETINGNDIENGKINEVNKNNVELTPNINNFKENESVKDYYEEDNKLMINTESNSDEKELPIDGMEVESNLINDELEDNLVNDKIEINTNEKQDLENSEKISNEQKEEVYLKNECKNEEETNLKSEKNLSNEIEEDIITEKVENNFKNKKAPLKKANKKENIEEQPLELRRSSRQRKPVTLFSFGDISDRGNDSDNNSKKKKNIKKDRPKVKSTKELKKAKKKQHKAEKLARKAEKKKLKKSKRDDKKRKNSKPWEATESSDDVEHADDDLELYMEQESDVEHSSDNKDTDAKKFDSDLPESDFDINNLSASSDEETMKSRGRNYFRQKKRQYRKKKDEVAVEVEEEDVTLCQICLGSKVPEMMLLCDQCDLGHHAMCLKPSLMIIPEGDWFCPKCCHKKLLEELNNRIPELEKQVVKNLAKIRMQERLNFVNISMSNILSKNKNNRDRKRENCNGEEQSDYDSDNDCDENDDDEVSGGSDSDSSSDNGSSSENGSRSKSKSPSAKRPYKFRESSRKEAHKYNFEELDKMFDEALVYDEKYQLLKKQHESGIIDENGEPIEGANNGNDDEEEDDDEDAEMDNDGKKNSSESDYDYSGLIARKKSSGKDIANVLGSDDDDDNDKEKTKDKSETEEENKNEIPTNDKPKLLTKRPEPPERIKASRKRPRLTIDDSFNDEIEDEKDEDFRLSEVEEDLSEEEIQLRKQFNSDSEDEFDEGDLSESSDDWRNNSSRKRRSTRIKSNRRQRSNHRLYRNKRHGKHKSSKKDSKKKHSGSRRQEIETSGGRRPTRSAARKVNYREMVGEDDNDNEEYNEELYGSKSSEEEKSPVGTRKILTAMHPGDKCSPPDVEKSPEFELSEEETEKFTEKSKSIKAQSTKKKSKSDSEYEASEGSEYEEEDEEENESDSTDKLEIKRSPEPEDDNACEEPPVKQIKLDPALEIATVLESVKETIVPDPQIDVTPPILTADDVDVCLKNPMRASFKQPLANQMENVEDEVDYSDNEVDMSSIKRS